MAALLCDWSAGALSLDSGAKIAVNGGTEAGKAVAEFKPGVQISGRTDPLAECPEREVLYNDIRRPAVWPAGEVTSEIGRVAGGGAFVLRNSWGTAWGKPHGRFGGGYGTLFFDYVAKYGLEAFA